MKKLLFIVFISLFTFNSNAQDSADLPKKLTINGYIKDMQNLSFSPNFKELISGNLIHNRINIKWKPTGKITAAAEFRNRLYWGEEVKLTPGYAKLLQNENERFDMQKIWIDNPSMVLVTNVERLYVDYQGAKLNVRIGRQRINWGITTTWNPNDIFNTYNFLDFDYEERPGVDGGKGKYVFGNGSNVELAYTLNGKNFGTAAAAKYSINKWNYDMQLIAGWYNSRPTLGGGWAGYIKDAGFKGEVQYFFGDADTAGHVNLSLESDYMFKKGWYLDVGLLFNNYGLYQPVTNWDTISFKLSPEYLMPTKWNLVLSTAKQLTPLFTVNMGVMYAPGTNLILLLPSLQYNLAANMDLDFIWQSYFTEMNNCLEAVNHRCFLRFKWSF